VLFGIHILFKRETDCEDSCNQRPLPDPASVGATNFCGRCSDQYPDSCWEISYSSSLMRVSCCVVCVVCRPCVCHVRVVFSLTRQHVSRFGGCYVRGDYNLVWADHDFCNVLFGASTYVLPPHLPSTLTRPTCACF
jgi:hypothetical protein